MKLPITFIYHAEVIKKRCRKPVTVPVKATVSIEIKEFISLPVAFRLGDIELFWDAEAKRLWKWSYPDYKDAPKERVLKLTVDFHTRNCGVDYKYSMPGTEAPFHNIWFRMSSGIHEWLKDEIVLWESSVKESVGIREWVSDNRQEVIDFIEKKAAGMATMNGYMLEAAREPIYYTCTFGMGSNHGGTGLFVGSTKASVAEESFEFPADQLSEAIEYAESVALNRGDTDSVPMSPSGGVVQVLIPEAVQFRRKNAPDSTVVESVAGNEVLCD
ncbi:hypothetical protein [Hydrogenovibrio marinus]|uniref:Uncharacterized protein n=1 Tax=Hydrogenovibrio marinus TaxID=28885 RepID=A0A066ZQZ6_HYDMR|nr:hypothetical protein [Hydrogenovibrio marinus]KDN94664.1 hypothetical protein EI16_12255 [Hydrogenovibrio marinus]